MKRAFVLLIGCLVFCGAAAAEKRVALVIGNSNYEFAPLDNPKNDAEDLAGALQRLDFEVTKGIDLTIAEFDRAVDKFTLTAKDADVALFYFSGHGVQIDKRGFLAPVGIKAESESSALRELVAITEVVSRIENAAKASVIVLDACRNSPLQERLRRFASEKDRGLIPAKGLPPVSVTGSNTLVVYATAPGETASDGAGRNSPFTSSLLRHIETPGVEIELMFKRVTADVLRETGGKQQPERLSRLQIELVLHAQSEVAESLPKLPAIPPEPQRVAGSLYVKVSGKANLNSAMESVLVRDLERAGFHIVTDGKQATFFLDVQITNEPDIAPGSTDLNGMLTWRAQTQLHIALRSLDTRKTLLSVAVEGNAAGHNQNALHEKARMDALDNTIEQLRSALTQ